MKRSIRYSIITLVAFVVVAATAFAQVPRTISFQGVLTDNSGVAISDGMHDITFNIYSTATGGASLYTEEQQVNVMGGVFTTLIGSVNPIPASMEFNGQHYLGVSVDGSAELMPRTMLSSVPSAFSSLKADIAAGLEAGATGAVTSINGAEGDITLQGGGGTTLSLSGNTLTISSSGTGGTGIQGVQNVDGTLNIQDANGPVATITIANGGVTDVHIAANAVTEAKIAADAVTSAKIAAGAVMDTDIAANAVTTAKIAADAVTEAQIAANAVTSAQLAADAVTEAKIAADAVTTAKIAADAVTTAELAAGAVTEADIAADAVTNAKIAADAVGEANIMDGAVTTAKLDVNGASTGDVLKVSGTSAVWGTVSGNFSLPFMDTLSTGGSAFSVTNLTGDAMAAASVTGTALMAASSSGTAVTGTSLTGPAAEFTTSATVVAHSALTATSNGTGAAVEAVANTGAAVMASSTAGAGVVASSDLANIIEAYGLGNDLRFRVLQTGDVRADGAFTGGGADLAEAFDFEGAKEEYEPGDVLAVSTDNDRTIVKSSGANNTAVIGVYATKPGVVLAPYGADENLDRFIPVGVVGVIPTKVTTENGPISRGDLLVTSSTPGYAMKAKPVVIEGVPIYPSGAIIGKALENYDGTGSVKINVMVNVK